MAHCIKCGSELVEGAKFCFECGESTEAANKLKAKAAATAKPNKRQTAPSKPSAKEVAEAIQNQALENANSGSKKKPSGCLIIFLIILALGVISSIGKLADFEQSFGKQDGTAKISIQATSNGTAAESNSAYCKVLMPNGEKKSFSVPVGKTKDIYLKPGVYAFEATSNQTAGYVESAPTELEVPESLEEQSIEIVIGGTVKEEKETTAEGLLGMPKNDYWDAISITEAYHSVKVWGEKAFPYGFELHYVLGGHEESIDEDDPSVINLKSACDITNGYGATQKGLLCEATVRRNTDEATFSLLMLSVGGQTIYSNY